MDSLEVRRAGGLDVRATLMATMTGRWINLVAAALGAIGALDQTPRRGGFERELARETLPKRRDTPSPL
jgi:hypothetical protein